MMYAFDGIKAGIEQFKILNPNIEIIENVYEFKELRQALIFNEVDVIFSVSIALEDLNNVSRKCLSKMELCIAMSETHPLASQKELNLEELNSEVFFFPSARDTQTRSNNELEQCNQIGFSPKSIQYLPNLSSVIKAVREGKGMTMCGKYRDLTEKNRIRFFPLNIPANANQPYVEAAWRTNDVPAEVKELIKLI